MLLLNLLLLGASCEARALHLFTPERWAQQGRQALAPLPDARAGDAPAEGARADHLRASVYLVDGPAGRLEGARKSPGPEPGDGLASLMRSVEAGIVRSTPALPASHFRPFLIRAAVVLSFAFILFFTFNKWHDDIQARTSIKVEHVCCCAYAALSISIDLSIKNAALSNGGTYSFHPACAVIVVEVLKFSASTLLFGMKVKQSWKDSVEVMLPGAKDIAWLAVPGFVYTCNNMIVFKAIQECPLAAFGVIRETMLIWNAVLWTAVFNQSVGRMRWLAILVIFAGCVANQVPAFFRAEFTWGVLWAFLLALCNAVGAVANEFAMKRKASLDINLQNMVVYFFCGCFGVLYLVVFARPAMRNGLFHGFKPPCVQVVLLQALTGLAVSRILKYVDAVTKTIVAALRGPGVIFFGALVFHTKLRVNEVVATVVVCVACFIYLKQGPLVSAAKAVESPQKL